MKKMGRPMPRHFGYCRSGYHLFKLIRRFLFGNSPFFLQSSTAHLSAACGFSENSTTRFPFLSLLLSTAPLLSFFGCPPLFPITLKWLAVWTHWNWANAIPAAAHRGPKSVRMAGDVAAHLSQ